MAKMIADGLEREPLGKQMAGTGMAQCMGAAMGCLDTQAVEAAAGQMVQAAGRKGAKGRFEGQKHFPAAAAGTHVLEIAHDGAAHFMGQRINLGPVLLVARDRELLQRPVDVLKPQPGDLAAAQTIHDEQQQDSAIANGAGLLRIARRDDLPGILPSGTGR